MGPRTHSIPKRDRTETTPQRSGSDTGPMTLNPPPTHPAAVLRLRCDACPPADRLIEHLASSESSGVSSGPALPDRLLSHAAHAARFLALAGGIAMKALLTT